MSNKDKDEMREEYDFRGKKGVCGKYYKMMQEGHKTIIHKSDCTEILWNNDLSRDFIADLKSFAMSLNHYQIVFDLTEADEKKYLELKNGNYKILSKSSGNVFKCPNCRKETFEIIEGEIKEKPALGLACLGCETYGAVFPKGL